jgi:hypothetical protein
MICHEDKSDRQILLFIVEELGYLRGKVEDMGTGITNLNNAVQKITDDLTAEQTVIQEVLTALQNGANGGGLSDADSQALADKLGRSAQNIETITTNLQNALPPQQSQTQTT